VTLAPRKFVVAEGAAASFDPKRIQAWTRQLLRGLNFVGMVEAALYTNFGHVSAGFWRVVAWHVYLLAWGVSEAQLAPVMDNINRRYEALLPGVDPAFGVPVAKEEVVGKALYMLKAPQSEYRVYPKRATRIDRETGEITTPTTGRFKQKKQALRSGDMVRMCNVMADKHLHRLMFAGGGGAPLLNAVRAEALEPLRREEAREASRRAATGSSPHRDSRLSRLRAVPVGARLPFRRGLTRKVEAQAHVKGHRQAAKRNSLAVWRDR
jgi:hypothetical protein